MRKYLLTFLFLMMFATSSVANPYIGYLDVDNLGGGGSLTANSVEEVHLKAVDTAADEECLTYETTTGDFEWQTCGAGGGDNLGDHTATQDIDLAGFAITETSGTLELKTAPSNGTATLVGGSGSADLIVADSASSPGARWQSNFSAAQYVMGIYDSAGNQLVITNGTNYAKDHDHAAQTNPTVYIHSDTDPDTSNTQYMSLVHDQTNAEIASGTGDIVLDSASQIDLETGGAFGVINEKYTSNFLVTRHLNSTNAEYKVGVDDSVGNQFIITNRGNVGSDHDHDTTTHPTLFIHSDTDPDTDNTEYLEFYHDGTNSNIANGSGTFVLESAGNRIDQVAAAGYFTQKSSTTNAAAVRVDTTGDQYIFSIDDAVGNQMILTNYANRAKDHDHATTTDPTLFIHSDTDPDTANDEWLSLSHDQTDGMVAVGTGSLILSAPSGIGVGTVGDGAGCLMGRDSDDAGWTECNFLNGVMSCSIDTDGVCDGS